MGRPNRTSTTAVLLVCVLGTQWMGATVFAGGEEAAPGAARPAAAVRAPLETHQRLVIDVSRFTLADEPSAFAQHGRGFRGRGRNEGARAALVVGTLATIGGAALLVYANRPACRGNASADACGYGTKVVGGALLTGGAIGLVAGAISWR